MARSNQPTSEPWRVGVLFSRTGVTAVIEETQLRGTLLAIAEVNDQGGVGGRELMPIVYDPGSESVTFGHLARRLMVEDGVSAIFGCYTSSSRKAVLPVVERLNGLLWYPTPYEGFEYSPNIIYTGATPNQHILTLCAYLLEHYGTRFYLVGSDYVYPRETNRLMRELLGSHGGEVVGESYVSLQAGARDFRPIITALRKLRPDVIFSTVVGDATTHLYHGHAEAGFDPTLMPIASLTTTEAEIQAMGPAAGAGHITAAPYFQCIKGERNAGFVARYHKRYGNAVPTNTCAEAAYFQVHIFVHALEQAGSTDTESLRPLVLDTAYEAPQGAVAINGACNHANVWTRIGRANQRGQFDLVHQSAGAVVADPYLTGYGRTPPRSVARRA